MIGAGSVVRGEFEPYSVIIGNPAIQVKKRFSNEIIEILKTIDFNILDSKKILENLHRFYTPLDINLVLEIKGLLEGSYNE